MNELQIFNNEEFGEVRTVSIGGEPWFVGKDVATALGYSNHKDALAKHIDEEDKRGSQIATPGGTQEMTIINESGLYSLIFGSRLESAKRFKRWVTSEVLPAVRKTGRYEVQPQRELTKDDYIRAASIVAGCRNERMPYVLNFLERAGFSVPELESEAGMKREADSVDRGMLVKLMNDSGKSLNELSRLTHICKSALSYYRRGIYVPSPERYAVIIELLS